MYKKSYSNLVHWLLFGFLMVSAHLVSADDPNIPDHSYWSSNERTDKPETTKNKANSFQIQREFRKNRVLDISGSGVGAILTLQEPQNTISQQWYIDESDGMTIRSKLYNLCLISEGPYPAKVTLGYCGTPSKFFFGQNAENLIEMSKDGVCLDISNGNDTLGGYVMATHCRDPMSNKRLVQKWSFDYTKAIVDTTNQRTDTTPLFVIRTHMNSQGVLDASKNNGRGVVLNHYDNQISQKWYIGADNQTIRSALNDNCLVSNGYHPKLVGVEPCDSPLNKWFYNSANDQIQLAANPSRCLHAYRGGCGGGSLLVNRYSGNLTEFRCHGSYNQLWKLENVDSIVDY